MGGERNLRGEMEPTQDRLTELAARVALLSVQRPTGAAPCVSTPMLPAERALSKAHER
jgi:hypothetical protein